MFWYIPVLPSASFAIGSTIAKRFDRTPHHQYEPRFAAQLANQSSHDLEIGIQQRLDMCRPDRSPRNR
jgi:hypothetical protein